MYRINLNCNKDKNLIDEYSKCFTSEFNLYYQKKLKNSKKEIVLHTIFKHKKSNIFNDNNKKTCTLEEAFDALKRLKKYSFDVVFNAYSLKDVLLGDANTINAIKDLVINLPNNKDFLENAKFLFNYEKFRTNTLVPFFETNLDFRVCYYCNIDFINVYDKNLHKNKFTLDHFFDKDTYPYLALSLCNLVPSCYTCNSKIKGTKDFSKLNLIHTNPYNPNFKFDENVKFKLFFNDECKKLHIKDKNDFEIPLKEKYTNLYDVYIKEFELNERYKAHKDIVYDTITKAQRYPLSRLQELEKLTGIPYQQIRKDIFNLLGDDETKENVQFSKLIKDISEQLGILD